ncbi:hypothetical protein IEQ34_026366 [Dendrobium chrysotoxum]|uniref:Uncharacterized protein n=1 Tax=Dendrobium chrysotoxum TaxID=161865 RepID=A0AAV7FM84_DENCH|nr:hypothetical protein IEQ34_026366 [Dendrobium chrysotoxum]
MRNVASRQPLALPRPPALGNSPVLEFSEPTSPEVQVIIHSVAHDLSQLFLPRCFPSLRLNGIYPRCLLLGRYLRGLEHGRKLMQILAIAVSNRR